MPDPIRILIVADGEDALRLHKRVGCAARALHVALNIEEQRSDGRPARVFVESELLAEGLARTETLQDRLAQWLEEHGGTTA